MRQNVLITSAGRRGKLVSIFQKELKAILPAGKVYAADACPDLSVACQLAHGSFAVPSVEDPAYLKGLVDICTSNGIGLIVPTIDTELPILAAHQDRLAEIGTTAVISDAPFIRICRDKRLTARWFNERGLRTPREIDPRSVSRFPVFAKPYDGSSSQSTYVIHDSSDLRPALVGDSRMMFIEYLSPEEFAEYTIDAYFDRTGILRCLVPRLRIETRGGEVSKGRTGRFPGINVLQDRLTRIDGARGCLTVQVFVGRQTPHVYGIEINPRFGGGYPLSYEAGANFPRWLIQEYLQGKAVEFFDAWESNLTMLRYDDHVVVRGAAA